MENLYYKINATYFQMHVELVQNHLDFYQGGQELKAEIIEKQCLRK